MYVMTRMHVLSSSGAILATCRLQPLEHPVLQDVAFGSLLHSSHLTL